MTLRSDPYAIFSISKTREEGPVKNQIAKATVEQIIKTAGDHRKFKVYEEIQKAGVEPMDYFRFYHLCSYDRINDPQKTLISQMEANSGVTFYEAQIALGRQWEGPRCTGGDAPKKVFIKVPHRAQKVNIVRRFEKGSDDIRGDEDVSDMYRNADCWTQHA
ncbi:hypothetical protein BDR03DRAFT_1018067 [Suillus americanus]|nr:hypothetical protein BDR03DRAFT_1018067 [Suillus americanus]